MNRRHTSIQSLILSLAVALTLGAVPAVAQSPFSQVVGGPAGIAAVQESPVAPMVVAPSAGIAPVAQAAGNPLPAPSAPAPRMAGACSSLMDVVKFFQKAGQEAAEGARTTGVQFPAGAVQIVQF